MAESEEQRRLRKMIEDEERQVSLDSPMSKTESFLRGGAQGASLGFADELTGASEAGLDTLQGNTKPTFEDFINTYKRHRDESRENYKTAERINPYSYTGGQVVGGIAPLIASGGAGAGIQGAGRLGAIAGLGVSDQDLTNSDISVADKIKGTGSDMISGAGFGYAAASLPGAFSAIKNKIRPGAAISEVPADVFYGKIQDVLKNPNPLYKANITPYNIDDYKNFKTFLSNDGKSGYALKPDGELISVFSLEKGRGSDLVKDAVVNKGATKLDAFDINNKLPNLYGKYMDETSRLKFADEYAPKDWDYSKFGRPDVVTMNINPDKLKSTELPSGIFSKLKSKLNPKYKETKYEQDEQDLKLFNESLEKLGHGTNLKNTSENTGYSRELAAKQILDTPIDDFENLMRKLDPRYKEIKHTPEEINSIKEETAKQFANMPVDDFERFMKKLLSRVKE